MSQVCLFIFNPISGDNAYQKEEILEMLELKMPNFQTHLFVTTGENDSDKIKSEFDRVSPNLVMVGGGDGTVKLVAMSLKQEQVPICIVPFGSANGLAKCMGIDTIEDAWEAIRDFHVQDVDAIRIRDEICLHLSDFGFNANLVKRFEEKAGRGMLAYIQSSISEIFNAEPHRYLLEINGEKHEVAAKMLVIANGDRYGTGALINCKGKLYDGKFEIIALNPESAKDYIRMTLAMFRGDLEEQRDSKIWRGDSCVIHNLDKIEFQIDGEMMGKPEKISAEIEKHAFQFITSKTYAACQST
ncbi:diacylglycerol/lipid kinase family protein [Algoriphagus pacificus]|uniref:NAD(+)/NADH kinase n=1 Tax=Algoriphagus pacificus TaxID=2811234 RepID=A0ABS3CNZ1_9BACT|nr:diacylglycerol kinase family protein [Algoriphagus pacificus]MBN7817960.1 NAD(+)/NADH kinase [Algoriphagus pacificus]